MSIDPNDVVQLQLWPDEEMPSLEVRLPTEIEDAEPVGQQSLAAQLYLPGCEPEEED